MKRYWINQPSSAPQPDHALHGRRVLADMSSKENEQLPNQSVCYVYFTEGEMTGCKVSKSSLVEGWPTAPEKAS